MVPGAGVRSTAADDGPRRWLAAPADPRYDGDLLARRASEGHANPRWRVGLRKGTTMMRRLGLLVPALLGLLVLGAAPDANVERLLREGNAAFDRGDYEQAVEFYSQAEDRATDPGQVAYNKATALYRLALDEKEE